MAETGKHFRERSSLSNRNRLKKSTLLLGLIVGIGLSGLPAGLGLTPAAAFSQADGQQEFFEKKVRPILAGHCYACHNAKLKTAGLDLTSAAGFLRGGDSGPLISKEHPADSRLLKVISYEENPKMPPVGKLKPEEIEVLTAWVKAGAVWPDARPAATERKREGAKEFGEEDKRFWSFQPVANPAPPAVKNIAWVQSPVDRFILQKLEEKNLRPAPQAKKMTLLRRATFDLTGLPPSEAEIRDFLADDSPDAIRKVVERLLASPRYGERWGRHWLDVARYADSTGNDEDHRYPHAWKYRDYVIEAFNQDMPYDRFIREQIAGDLLPAGDGGVNRRGIIATGFLALGPKAIAQQDKKRMLYDVYDEQVDVTSRAFLGLTVSCARCHDHKFDPILTKDYYSLVSIFASTRSFKDASSHVSQVLQKPLVLREEYERYMTAFRAHQNKVDRNSIAAEEIINQEKEPAVKQWAARLADYMLAARKIYRNGATLSEVARQQKLSEDLLKKWADYLKPGDKVRYHLLAWEQAADDKMADTAMGYQRRFQEQFDKWVEVLNKWRAKYQEALKQGKTDLPDTPKFEAGEDRFFAEVYFEKGGPFTLDEADEAKLPPHTKEQLSQLRKEQEQLKKAAPPEPEMACAVEDGEVVQQKVFIRGDYNSLGPDAPKGYPAILTQYHKGAAITEGSGRLQLAEWVASPQNPLTARVMVNRIWQWHFGEGLVRTPDNYGRMGEPPTHPELLDFLARKFIESGWSIKALHRTIMLSSAYQMASVNPEVSPEADPEARLLSRFPRRRLDIEEVRDALLAIGGTLDLTMGGTLQTGTGTDGETSSARLSLNPEKLRRRTVYLPLRRANLPTLLNLFDFGDATTASGKRARTNVATQALFMLNSEFLHEHSRRTAELLLAQKNADRAKRLESAYLRILNRLPSADEVAQSSRYLDGFKAKFPTASSEVDGWQSLCRILMAANEFIYVD